MTKDKNVIYYQIPQIALAENAKALGIFAEQKAKHLVLGAYGCGVFQAQMK